MTRHRAALISNFNIDLDKGDNKYLISTLSLNKEIKEIYCVKRLQSQSCCVLMCNSCKICYHTYSCSCSDFSIRNFICKHIHFVAMFYNKKTKLTESEQIVCEENKRDTNLLERNVGNFEVLKGKFSARVLSTINKLQNTDPNTLNDEVILEIQRHLDIIDKLVDLPNSSTTDSFAPVHPNEPVNKKIQKQNRFFQLRKKEKRIKINVKSHPF